MISCASAFCRSLARRLSERAHGFRVGFSKCLKQNCWIDQLKSFLKQLNSFLTVSIHYKNLYCFLQSNCWANRCMPCQCCEFVNIWRLGYAETPYQIMTNLIMKVRAIIHHRERNSTHQSNATCCDQKHDKPFKVLVFHKAFHPVTYAHPDYVTRGLVKPGAAAALSRKTVVNFVFPDVQGTATYSLGRVTWACHTRCFPGCWSTCVCMAIAD